MESIRVITELELTDKGVINKEDFPEVIYLDSEDFSYNPKYLRDFKWYGVYEGDELICASAVSEDKEGICLELIETKQGWRGEGYASLLMDYLVKDLYKDKNFSLMGMYRDLDKFYEKWGFKVVQREPMLKMILNR